MHPYRILLDWACRRVHAGTMTVEYWDGDVVSYGRGEPSIRLKLHRKDIVPALLLQTEMAFGEAYTHGDIEVDGDMQTFLSLVTANDDLLPPFYFHLMTLASRMSRALPLSVYKNKKDVSRHYDLGNDFYRLWLDPTMTYSCAYFRSPDQDLETAQRQKIAHTLRKLCLKPGETLLDIGCGWGSLIREAARTYGVDALGITLSEQQASYFDKTSEGETPLSARVSLEHYHALASQGATFDKIVSVGMAEHVGKNNLKRFFHDLKKMLRPGGLGLLHCITGPYEGPTNPWIKKYIFPGGYIPCFKEIAEGMAKETLFVWDVENLGPHYALTLDRWIEAFDRNEEEVEARYGMEFVRMWRLYLHSCAYTFRRGGLFVHQVLFSNGMPKDLPLTREHLYVRERDQNTIALSEAKQWKNMSQRA
jgi:cyclopropane-fatty-acyl-phospholipid synthase